jgi:hypothetical protein
MNLDEGGEQERLIAPGFDVVSIDGVFHPVCGSMDTIQSCAIFQRASHE